MLQSRSNCVLTPVNTFHDRTNRMEHGLRSSQLSDKCTTLCTKNNLKDLLRTILHIIRQIKAPAAGTLRTIRKFLNRSLSLNSLLKSQRTTGVLKEKSRAILWILIPKMLKLIEEQTDGLMKSKDFAGGGAENPYCSFHASYLKKGERELKLLEKKSGRGCCCTTSDNSRQYVENQWSYSTKKFDDGEMTQTDALDEFLIRVHNETFAVSGMIFQDAWNLDLERLKRCYICEVDSDYGMVPFCAYNLTNSKGIYLYRK